jgi:hypothetical protein
MVLQPVEAQILAFVDGLDADGHTMKRALMYMLVVVHTIIVIPEVLHQNQQ